MPSSATAPDLAVPLLLSAIGLYLLAGLIVGGYGLLRIAPGADAALRGSGRSVRVLLLPGAAAVWPAAVWRWKRASRAGGPAPRAGS